jgi:histidyl-tRNA synthetase
LDKYEKLSKADFTKLLSEIDTDISTDLLAEFMQARSIEDLRTAFITLAGTESFREFEEIISTLRNLGYTDEIEFSGSLIR